MPRRKNHPKKRSPPSSGASATPTESESSTPPSPALAAAAAPVAEIPPLPASPPSEIPAASTQVDPFPESAQVNSTEPVIPAAPVDLSGAPVAAPGLIRSALRWIPILGRFI